ncbi:hypothetical protein [Arcticibacter sp.]|uniref:hypothetical protein n=1 Tax=Arcticibacter sp. TaxID=1872630 RepID=UPI00388F97E8
MKSIFTIILVLAFMYTKGQAITNMPINTPAIGSNASFDRFTYDNKPVGHYALGWNLDSWNAGGPTAYLSGYGGLKFFASGQLAMSVQWNGNVGIGTTTPRALLDVSTLISGGSLGTVFARQAEGNSEGDGTFLGVRAYGTQFDFGSKSFSIEHSFFGETNSSINFFRGSNRVGGEISFNTSSNIEQMRILHNGNVGIGTSSPTSKLTVAGTIAAREVKVTVNAGADFVFYDNYSLKPLQELESFIKKNNHLPEIASAKQMEGEGIDLSEMNIKLLQKIEELTLYVIKQQKDIEELRTELRFKK